MEQMLEPKNIIVHHSLWKDREGLNFPNVKADQIARGWDDCAYHKFIEGVNGSAVIVTGRPVQYEGGHTKGHNDSIGICVHGDYDAEAPPQYIVDCLVRVVLALWIEYPHLNGVLHYHNEYADKSCPGTKFPARKDVLAAVRRLRFAGMQISH